MNEMFQISRSRRQWEAVAKSRISIGESGAFIEADFVKQGLDARTAREILDGAFRSVRFNAIVMLIASASFAALGMLVTIASYMAAASNPFGGTYSIWYGPIVAGGIVSLVALGRLISIKR